jgi:hypothetical protein
MKPKKTQDTLRKPRKLKEFAMNPTAKPVKKSKKSEPTKKLERKNPLMTVRSLTVTWPPS